MADAALAVGIAVLDEVAVGEAGGNADGTGVDGDAARGALVEGVGGSFVGGGDDVVDLAFVSITVKLAREEGEGKCIGMHTLGAS